MDTLLTGAADVAAVALCESCGRRRTAAGGLTRRASYAAVS